MNDKFKQDIERLLFSNKSYFQATDQVVLTNSVESGDFKFEIYPDIFNKYPNEESLILKLLNIYVQLRIIEKEYKSLGDHVFDFSIGLSKENQVFFRISLKEALPLSNFCYRNANDYVYFLSNMQNALFYMINNAIVQHESSGKRKLVDGLKRLINHIESDNGLNLVSTYNTFYEMNTEFFNTVKLIKARDDLILGFVDDFIHKNFSAKEIKKFGGIEEVRMIVMEKIFKK